MPTMQFPLVGSYHRPPAAQLLANLPSAAGLALRAEPDNAYDPHAIQVWAFLDSVPDEAIPALQEALNGTGFTLEDLEEAGSAGGIHLGYVGASDGKPCATEGLPGNQELKAMALRSDSAIEDLPAVLGFAPSGKPTIQITFEA